jgi:hypothetical protein
VVGNFGYEASTKRKPKKKTTENKNKNKSQLHSSIALKARRKHNSTTGPSPGETKLHRRNSLC